MDKYYQEKLNKGLIDRDHKKYTLKQSGIIHKTFSTDDYIPPEYFEVDEDDYSECSFA